MTTPLRGIYAITPDWPDAERIHEAALAALAGGIRLLQLRYKGDAATRRSLARRLHTACTEFEAALIINDDLDLACEIDAHGVHLGQHDGALAGARARLHPQQWLGASCYNRLDLAQAAVAAGADYVAFGSVFASHTKPDAVHAPLELFAQARRLNVPCIAIGGITLDNAPRVFTAGADAVAVIADLFEQDDIQARAAAFVAAFDARVPPLQTP
ncbi:MAG: thiamine phosphate synthase [Burkholderiaceae bacterium]|nr:MAG: thiamine phosphate synthase [Burkholderiaceae bacterium]